MNKKQVVDKEFSIAFNRCLSNGVMIYPRPIKSVYKVLLQGKRKSIKPKVELVVDYGNNKKVISKEIYTQEDDMAEKIIELYKIINSKI